MTTRLRWTVPAALLGLTAILWIIWFAGDPRLVALNYISSGSPPRRYILGISAFDLFESLHASLLIIGWISLGGGLLTALAAWLRPRLLGAAAVFALTATVYAMSAALIIQEQSEAPHYVYLADAFLHGRTTLESRPPEYEENDWTLYEGEWSVSFPPAPALLMLPFVAVWGLAFNDVIFTLLLGALNVTIFYQLVPLIQRKITDESGDDFAFRAALTLAFGFGTVHWWLSVNGQVWFTAHIAATTLLLLALFETFRARRPVWVALWMGGAALARPPILFALPAFLWLLRKDHSWRQLVGGAAPLFGIGILMGVYNFSRYGDPLELGYRYMQLETLLAKRVFEYGTFNLIYLKENLINAFTKLPNWQTRWPFAVMDGWGMSMILSTPALVYGFFAPWRERTACAMGAAALLVAIPNLLYYNTGYLQAGYRYSLDFLPFLFVLAALGMRGRLRWHSIALIGFSVVMGLLSVGNFIRLAHGGI